MYYYDYLTFFCCFLARKRGEWRVLRCVVAYPEAVVRGEGVEDLVGAPLKRGCRGGGVGLAWVVACGRVQRIPSFAGLGYVMH